MSGSKGGKRISVFDRLGPGNDEAPPPAHRRYSSEKHVDKGRHAHPHVRGEEPPRERKPSHQDFEENKHLHYRDVPPPPPPPSSHPRHRHFHETPETEYSEEEGGRRAPPRKPRETPEAVMGEGYPKHRVPPDDRGSKLVRGGGGGGGKTKPRGGEGGIGRSSSESSAENELASGNEGKRRRSAHHREMERRPRHSLETVNLPEDGGRRLPKHLEKKEKVSERHAHLERLPPPPGSGSNSEAKGPKPKGEGKDERESLGYHKRRREDEYFEPRLERKRKREHLDEDLFPPETKKPRTAEYLPPLKDTERQSMREGEEKHAGRMREVGEGGERKRRYEGREPPARKHPHLQSPDMRRHGWPPVTSPGGVGRKGEYHHWKGKKLEGDESPPSETDSAADEAAAARKKLDWSSLSALTLAAKPRKVSTSALKRFSPGVLLAQMGTSPLLAGPELYVKVSNTVSKYLREGQQSGGVQSLSESVLENPFGSLELASAGVSRLEQQQKLNQLFTDVGPCRRALTASVDFAMRRKLRKNNRDFLPSSHPPSNWDSEHYATGLALYQSLGTKASGKPAFRLHQSRVGTVLIAR